MSVRAEKAAERARKERSAASRRRRVYGLTVEQDERLAAWQGRRCPICLRATGATKRLSVDHDHKHCSGKTSCGLCVRGRLCDPCNGLLAHCRDDVDMLLRAIDYLLHPPAERALARRQLPDGSWTWAHPLPDPGKVPRPRVRLIVLPHPRTAPDDLPSHIE